MTDPTPLVRDVSDTCLWTAAYRADESERPDALFRDPWARELAGERGAEMARQAHFAVRHAVVLRTRLLDEVIEEAAETGAADTVLQLACGLDTRPYRLRLPETLRWVEVDLPGVIEHKAARLEGETPVCSLERVALDLADRDARRRLFHEAAAGSRLGVLVVTEGLLSYLEPEQVAELAEDLHAEPMLRTWATDLSTLAIARGVRTAADELSGGAAPSRFAPEEGTAFFEPNGWRETAWLGYFSEAPRVGRDHPISRMLRVGLRLAPRTTRVRMERGSGVAILERIGG